MDKILTRTGVTILKMKVEGSEREEDGSPMATNDQYLAILDFEQYLNIEIAREAHERWGINFRVHL